MSDELPDLGKLAQFSDDISKSAGDTIKRLKNEHGWSVGYKGDRNLVTTADIESQRCLVSAIQKHFPDHRVLAEEEDLNDPNLDASRIPHLWILDPLDGTTNFVYGQSHFAVSVAYAHYGQIQVGTVFSPMQNECFSAVRGGGARLNGAPIATNPVTDIREAVVATGFPYAREKVSTLIEQVRAVVTSCRDLRRNGAASLDLCWVACGRLDAYYESVEPWDMAAGALIVREAGGKVGAFPDSTRRFNLIPDLACENLLASAPGIYHSLSEALWAPLCSPK